jgi:signal recognition particle GTPase
MTDQEAPGGIVKLRELISERLSVAPNQPLDAVEEEGKPNPDAEIPPEKEQPPEAKGTDKEPTREELLEAYSETWRLMQEKEREMDELRRHLAQMGEETRFLMKRAEDEAFKRDMGEAYKQDPMAATAMMVERSKQEALQEMSWRLNQAIKEQRGFDRFMRDFLEDPAHSHLKPYEQQLELLILEKGLSPDEAAEVIQRLEKSWEDTNKRRFQAAKEIRNRSAVESGGEVSTPVDRDSEFDRVIKKAKTLDEMFAGLNKLKG